MDGLVRFCGEISLLCGEIQKCPRRHRCLPFSMKTYSESHDHEKDYMKADDIFQRPLFRIFSRFNRFKIDDFIVPIACATGSSVGLTKKRGGPY